jgi:hypothetical protein
MSAKLITYLSDSLVDSSSAVVKLDSDGAPISGVRMDTSKAYSGIPHLLKKVINDGSNDAWNEITKRIDYIYDNLNYVFNGLEEMTGFLREIKSQLKSGKKLFFKPNLVFPDAIDSVTHDEGPGFTAVTDWSLIAALMRWFHDIADVSYHQMALGEAASATSLVSFQYTQQSGKRITTEAVIEGRSGGFHGGWGFFFVRKYLSDRHPAAHIDDPMNGYEESISGRYIPPGMAKDQLMVYDLNLLSDQSRGRTLPVPEGANFHEITLHKVIVGGNPDDDNDLRDYPGCVLINVPKLKMHDQDLITNAIKNLGIGLYPMQIPYNDKGKRMWKYAYPSTDIPVLKCLLPHYSNMPVIDENTGLPARNKNGEYIISRTAGMSGTQADVIRAAQSQGILMLHVVDAIESINLNHNGSGARVPEGFVWSSLDCVALDVFCARYCFKTVPMHEALKLKEENGWPTEFVHHVPMAKIEGKNIVTEVGFDSPLFRYELYNYAEKRGIGQQNYFVIGWDSKKNAPMGSVQGHLGRIEDGHFVELLTKEMYYNSDCFVWDMQKTVFSYIKSSDALTGSCYFNDIMSELDENGDGQIDYNEKGWKGCWAQNMRLYSDTNNLKVTGAYGQLKAGFKLSADILRYSDKNWNSLGHDFFKALTMISISHLAFKMSQAQGEHKDSFFKNMSWGKGKWPSWQLVRDQAMHCSLYGSQIMANISLGSIYGNAFQYADKSMNGGSYSGSKEAPSTSDSINKYFKAISEGKAPLDFTLFVPPGYGKIENELIPNVKETDDPVLMFSAHFNGGQEVW